MPKVKLEVAVGEESVEAAVNAICESARTGQVVTEKSSFHPWNRSSEFEPVKVAPRQSNFVPTPESRQCSTNHSLSIFLPTPRNYG